MRSPICTRFTLLSGLCVAVLVLISGLTRSWTITLAASLACYVVLLFLVRACTGQRQPDTGTPTQGHTCEREQLPAVLAEQQFPTSHGTQ